MVLNHYCDDIAAERFDALVQLWKSKQTCKISSGKKKQILESPSNELGTTEEGRKHLTVFEGMIASCHLSSSYLSID